jgi:putative nucleotidyltransferase with HDIG domain
VEFGAEPEQLAIQALIEESRSRRTRRPLGRERAAEMTLGAGFLLVAVPLALLAPGGLAWSLWALPLATAYVVASRVHFEVGAGYTYPTQAVFVAILFALPTGSVPLVVAACLIAGNVPGYLTGRVRPGRAVVGLNDAWHSVGPALVLVLAGTTTARWGDWPVYLVALAAQFGCDVAASTTREWLATGTSPRIQLRVLGWVYLVDAVLAPLGLLVALASVDAPWAFVLVLPLLGLLAVFAHERHARIDHALELSHAYRGTALLLGDVVEADDHYTGLHTKGVTALATMVAQEMRLDAQDCRHVELAAILHDVGKISIPKEIINKPGPLTEDEWTVVRTHTIEGQRMLERVGGALGEVGAIVRATHERWDGTGYPDGLEGETIPLPARIVACCDAYHAMRTDRSYRRALPAGFALEEMRSCAGTQFDPAVVEVLVEVVHQLEPELAVGMLDETLLGLVEEA